MQIRLHLNTEEESRHIDIHKVHRENECKLTAKQLVKYFLALIT